MQTEIRLQSESYILFCFLVLKDLLFVVCWSSEARASHADQGKSKLDAVLELRWLFQTLSPSGEPQDWPKLTDLWLKEVP